MRLLHGENQLESRQALRGEVDEAKAKGAEVVELNGMKLELSQLKQALESKSFLAGSRLTVIENLIGSPASGRKKEVLDYLRSVDEPVVLWEPKKIDLRLIKGMKLEVEEFKLTVEIFKLVEAIVPGNRRRLIELLDRCLKTEPGELVFYMIVRQVRQMLLVLDDGFEGPDWLKRKLLSQARQLGRDNLLKLHARLYQIDRDIKTGLNPLPLSINVELCLVQL